MSKRPQAQLIDGGSLSDLALIPCSIFNHPSVRQCCNILPMVRSRQRSSTRTSTTSIARSAATAPYTLGVDSEVSSIRAGTRGSSTSGGVRIDNSFARSSDSTVFSQTPAPSGRAIRTRFGQHGKPLLLPKPTLAAHNGRLLLGHHWTGRGMYSSVAGTT